MEFKIAWLFPKLLEQYGNDGNIIILKKRCEELGINLIIDEILVGEDIEISKYDAFYLCGGEKKEQEIMVRELLNKKNEIKEAIENNKLFLLSGGGYNSFGKYTKYINGDEIEGLNIFDYYTIESKNKIIDYIVSEVTLGDNIEDIVGFESHSEETYSADPCFGLVKVGVGNNIEDKKEGFRYKNLIGTYIQGPILARNLELTDYFIKIMGNLRGYNIDFKDIGNSFEKKAKESLLKELI